MKVCKIGSRDTLSARGVCCGSGMRAMKARLTPKEIANPASPSVCVVHMRLHSPAFAFYSHQPSRAILRATPFFLQRGPFFLQCESPHAFFSLHSSYFYLSWNSRLRYFISIYQCEDLYKLVIHSPLSNSAHQPPLVERIETGQR